MGHAPTVIFRVLMVNVEVLMFWIDFENRLREPLAFGDLSNGVE